MGFQKYQKVEKVEIQSQDEHERIQEQLHHFGKTSARELTDEERAMLDNHTK